MIVMADFLLKTVPHFLQSEDSGDYQYKSGLAFVQTAQRFYNANQLVRQYEI